MCNCKHRCVELLEVVTSAAQVFLPDNTRLRENLITSVWVKPSDPAGSLTFLSPLARNIASWSVLNSSYFFAVNQNGNTMAKISVDALIRTTYAPEPLAVSWLELDPTQSFFQINTGAAGYSATAAIVIEFGIACDVCGLSPNNSTTAKGMAQAIV